jgi:cellulose synthase/poly-beta-1,6-N-acetylglucosamine synthase-like glycosyltransferase
MAHNEERVIEGSLRALLASDYPADRLTITPVNDRSTDKTAALIDALAAHHPHRIRPLHRTDGAGGKPAALEYACQRVDTEIIVVFDADYLPGKGLLKQLVCPFFDPEVGATMGRVIPLNARSNLLTQTLALERCAGYQVNQQARENLRLTAQYGGTVGALRKAALQQVGGWSTDCLAEDTDMTFRLRFAGWKIVYQNRAECYEEVPEEWGVRIRQLARWTSGHHQVLMKHWRAAVSSDRLSVRERIDASLLLAIFMLAPIILIGWSSGIYLFFDEPTVFSQLAVWVMVLILYSGFGNFATFVETAAGAFLDRSRGSLVLLPFMAINFMISTVEISKAILGQCWKTFRQQRAEWNKTSRYRKSPTHERPAQQGNPAQVNP